METLLKQELKEALQSQFAHEVLNSHIYLFIASFLHGKGLDNLAKHFEGQWKEEQEHSQIIYSLITDLGEVFEIPDIDGFGIEFPTFRALAEAYLAREILTTDSLNEIKLLAQSEDSPNPVVEERIREMILLQQHEYEEATSMLDKAILLPEWWQVALLDGAMDK
jgi:ferritin